MNRVAAKFMKTYVIIILTVTLFVIPIYWQAYNSVRDSVINDSYATLKYGCGIFDNELVKMRELAGALRNERDFAYMARLAGDRITTGDYYTIHVAHNNMKKALLQSDFILDCFFLFDKNDILLSRDRIFMSSIDISKMGFFQPETNFDEWLVRVNENRASYAFIPDAVAVFNPSGTGGASRSTAVYTIALPLGSFNHDSRIVYLLDSEYILRLICPESVFDGGFIAVTDQTGQTILSHNLNGFTPKDYGGSGIYEEKQSGGNMVVMTVNESDMGLRVVAGIAEETFRSRVRSMTSLLFLYLCLSIIIGLITAAILAYRESRPINRLLREAAKLDEAVRTSLFDKLISNRLFDREEIALIRKNLGFLEQPYRIAVLKFHNTEGFEDGRHVDLMKIIAANIMKKHVQGDLFIHNIIPGMIVALLPFEGAGGRERAAAVINDIATEISKETGVKPAIGVSEPQSGYECANKGYRQAVEAMRTADIKGRSDAAVFSEADEESVSYHDISDIQRLYELLLAGERKAVDDIIDGIYMKIASQKQLSEDIVLRVYYSINNILHFVSRELSVDEEEAAGYTEGCTLSELFVRLKNSAEAVCLAVDNRKKSRNSQLKESVIAYIKANYADSNLYASSVSKVFGISEKYLYNFIKEQTGRSFGDYLNDVRLEHAKRMLRETDLSINVIAANVGFNSHNTFYKVFHRVHGMAPGVWREIQKNLPDET